MDLMKLFAFIPFFDPLLFLRQHVHCNRGSGRASSVLFGPDEDDLGLLSVAC